MVRLTVVNFSILHYVLFNSGTQTCSVSTRDSAVQCTLLSAPPLTQANSPKLKQDIADSTESEDSSGTDEDYYETEESTDLEW